MRKHPNLMSVSDNAVFRISVNKDEQDLPVRKSATERRLQLENIVSKVVAG